MRRPRFRSLSTKLISAALVSGVILGIGILATYSQAVRQAKIIEATAADVARLVNWQRINSGVGLISEVAAIINPESAGTARVRWKASREAIARELVALQKTGNEEGLAVVENLQRLLGDADAAAVELFPILLDGNPDDIEAMRVLVISSIDELREAASSASLGQQKQVLSSLAVAQQRAQDPLQLLIWTTVATLLLGFLWLAIVAQRVVLKPIAELQRVTTRVLDQGDLTQTISSRSTDELGDLTNSFARMVEKLRELPTSLVGLVERLVTVTGALEGATSTVGRGADRIHHQVHDASGQVDQTMASLEGVASGVNVLRNISGTTAAANQQMNTSAESVASAAQELSRVAAQTSNLVREATQAAHEVAEGLEAVDDSVRETSTAISELDAATRSVEDLASKCRALATETSKVADLGVGAASDSQEGFEAVRDSTGQVSQLLDGLRSHMSRIGEIIKVINEVADQTKLLSLNASIIAAQAGDRGRSFSVVADEIRVLSERTATSSGEIRHILEKTQSDVGQVVEAFGTTQTKVDLGLSLTEAITDAFSEVQAKAKRTEQMVSAIARAASEQASTSQQLVRLVDDVTSRSTRMKEATVTQARQVENLEDIATSAAQQSSTMEDAASGQLGISRHVAESLEELRVTAGQLQSAHERQDANARGVRQGILTIEEAARAQSAAVGDLAEITVRLTEYTLDLRRTLETYRF